MAWVKKNTFEQDQKLVGFWTREPGEVLEGVVKRLVTSRKYDFYVLRLTRVASGDESPTFTTASNPETFTAEVGENVAVSACADLGILAEVMGKKVRIEAKGKGKRGNMKREMYLFDVYVDEGEDAEATDDASAEE